MTATFAVAGVVLVRALAFIAIEAWAVVKLGVGNDPDAEFTEELILKGFSRPVKAFNVRSLKS
jgi:hypothetical protein